MSTFKANGFRTPPADMTQYQEAFHSTSVPVIPRLAKGEKFSQDGRGRWNANENIIVKGKGGKKTRRPDLAGFNNGFTPINQDRMFYNSNKSSFISQKATGQTSPQGFVDGRHARPRSGPGFSSAYNNTSMVPDKQVNNGKKKESNSKKSPSVAVQSAEKPIRSSPPNYAGPKFAESPDASCLPMPPAHWFMDAATKSPIQKPPVHPTFANTSPSCGAAALLQPGMRLTGRQLLDLLNVRA